jgi:beta-lactamase regulating signal transducer with metallopeptidase domain
MMTAWMLESAFRSLMMAAVVWAGIKMLRVSNVVVQKTAWILVLIAALAMPGLMRLHMLQPKTAVVVPVHTLVSEPLDAPAANTATITVLSAASLTPAPVRHWSLSDVKSFIAPIYLAVCALLLLRLIVGLAMAFRIWRRAETASVLLDPRASVRISDDLQTPVTIGSCVILPESFTEWDQHKLRVVLAHERSHVRQCDFYWQLLAGVYAAIFWFNPLSWWLKKEISDLGEAISDGAALHESQSRANYAEVLVQFAAERQRPLAGVAMARSSNIRRRVDRLLVEQKFRSAFTTCKWHLAAAAALVPIALVAAIALVRVQTAEAMKLPQIAVAATPALTAQTPAAVIPTVIARAAVTPALAHPVVAQAVAVQDSADVRESTDRESANDESDDDDSNSYAIVSGNSTTMHGSWHTGSAFDRVKNTMHGNYIWFERSGKSYVIDDPALFAQAREYFKPMEELGRRQGELGKEQGRLGEEQGRLGALQAQASAPPPDLSKEMADLQASMKKLQEQKFTADAKAEDLSDMQARLADMQGKLADMQGRFGDAQAKIGEKQAALGDQQAKLGDQQAKLGEQQAALGEQQEQLSRAAGEKMKALIDNAMQNGKARPVE